MMVSNLITFKHNNSIDPSSNNFHKVKTKGPNAKYLLISCSLNTYFTQACIKLAKMLLVVWNSNNFKKRPDKLKNKRLIQPCT